MCKAKRTAQKKLSKSPFVTVKPPPPKGSAGSVSRIMPTLETRMPATSASFGLVLKTSEPAKGTIGIERDVRKADFEGVVRARPIVWQTKAANRRLPAIKPPRMALL